MKDKKEQLQQLLDIRGGHVEVRLRKDYKVVWVNVDGTCRVRICRIESLEVNDENFPGE